MTGDYSALAATSASDLWAVGTDDGPQPIAIHFDGTSWQSVPIPGGGDWTRVSGLVAVAPDDVWAVGDHNGALPNGFAVLRTRIEHWDGTSWSIVDSPNDSRSDDYLTSVSAAGGTVWAVGADGNTLIEQR